MPRGNPFYIEPGADFGPGLMGLTATVGRVNAVKRAEQKEQEEKDRVALMTQGAAEVYQTGDPDKIAEYSLQNPEIAKTLMSVSKFRNERTKENYIDSLFAGIQDPSKIPDIVASRQAFLQSQGVGPEGSQETDSFLEKYNTDQARTVQNMKKELAFIAPDKWKAYKDAQETGDYEGLSAGYETYLRANAIPNTPENYKKFQADLREQKTPDAGTWSKKFPDGSVRTVKNVEPDSEQEAQLIEQGFIVGSQTVGTRKTATERKAEKLENALGKLQSLAATDPNKFYEDHNFRMNDDGTLYLDPVTVAPIRLKQFTNTLGKRGNMAKIKALGEQWDDAQELMELLELPSVKKDLNESSLEIVDQAIGKTKNSLNAWLRRRGVAVDSNTATAMARIQRMASEERKRFMGTAVTPSEIQTALEWMPSSSDTFETMINKTRLVGKEAKQEFVRWVKLNENDSNMSPFYKAFGIKRFGEQDELEESTPSELHFDSQGNLIK